MSSLEPRGQKFTASCVAVLYCTRQDQKMEDMPELEGLRDEASDVSKKPESFSEVRKRRKRSKVSDMETEDDGPVTEETLKEAPAKRPVFPPVDATTIVVRKYLK